MPDHSQYALDPADNSSHGAPRYINSNGAQAHQTASSRAQIQYATGSNQHMPEYYAGQSESGSHQARPPRPVRRPSAGPATSLQQAAAPHDPVYMAARSSPIGPPPNAALPALPPPPSASRSPPPRTPLPRPPPPSNNDSGMLAMASESRPVTAVFSGDWDPTSAATNSQPQSSLQREGPDARYQSRGGSSTGRSRRQEYSEDSMSARSTPIPQSESRRQPIRASSISPPESEAGPSNYNAHNNRQRHNPSESSVDAEAHAGKITTERMASKTVLTIALAQAQRAVELDEAQEADAAIAAYSESVSLLEEVMRRVEENAGTYRFKELQKLRELRQDRIQRWRRMREREYQQRGERPPEVQDVDIRDAEIETAGERRDRLRRVQRLARRDQMRQEECHKLRLIHDTYAERVEALKEDAGMATSSTSYQSGGYSSGGQGESYSETRRQLAAMAIDDRSDLADYESQLQPSNTSARSRQFVPSGRGEDTAATSGIGSAMLANSPLSPTFSTASSSGTATRSMVRASVMPFPSSPPQPRTQTQPPAPARNTATVSHTSAPSLSLPDLQPFSFSPASSMSRTDSTQTHSQTVEQPVESTQQSMLSFSPDSDILDKASFAEQQQSPTGSSKRLSKHKKNSSSASMSKMLPPLNGFATFGDLAVHKAAQLQQNNSATVSAGQNGHILAQDTEGMATPTPDSSNSRMFVNSSPPMTTSDEMKRSQRTSEQEASRSRAGSRASQSALKRMTSNESLASNVTSSSMGGSHFTSAAQSMPMPPMPKVNNANQYDNVSPPVPSPPEKSSNRSSLAGFVRPLRSASLVTGMAATNKSSQVHHQSSASTSQATNKQPSTVPLINPTTFQGTISQRRKSPQMPDAETFESVHGDTLGLPSSDRDGMTGLGLTRSVSTEKGMSRRLHNNGGMKGIDSGSATLTAASAANSAGASSNHPFSIAGSLPMRLRALSQPNKRPPLPTFENDFNQPVPLLPQPSSSAPTMHRADSDPVRIDGNTGQMPNTPTLPATPMSMDYPASFDDSAQYAHSLSMTSERSATDQTISPTGSTLSGQPRTTASGHGTSFLEAETPATMLFGHHQSPSANGSLPHSSGKDGQLEYQPPPSDGMRVPFHFLRQIRASILAGAYLTPRLYIPKQLWAQSSMKLIHTETKVRMLDLLLNGLEAIERTGDVLLMDGNSKPVVGSAGSRLDAANRLMRELESFEGMLDGVQSTLAKKLPFVEQPNGKKGGGSFGAWSSKLSRSMDRMTKGKNLDAPETYVAAIARLCLHAQILDRHLASLHNTKQNAHQNGINNTNTFSNPRTSTDLRHQQADSGFASGAGTITLTSGYNDIPSDRRMYIENRLRKSSDFFSKVICKMLLNDLGIWLDKYSKRAAGWTTD